MDKSLDYGAFSCDKMSVAAQFGVFNATDQ